MYNEQNNTFRLPVDGIVEESAKVAPTLTSESNILTAKTAANDLSDKALFDELNSVSEELIVCRNRILGNIS